MCNPNSMPCKKTWVYCIKFVCIHAWKLTFCLLSLDLLAEVATAQTLTSERISCPLPGCISKCSNLEKQSWTGRENVSDFLCQNLQKNIPYVRHACLQISSTNRKRAYIWNRLKLSVDSDVRQKNTRECLLPLECRRNLSKLPKIVQNSKIWTEYQTDVFRK